MDKNDELKKLFMSKNQRPYRGLISDRPIPAFEETFIKTHTMNDEKIIVSRVVSYISFIITMAAGNLFILLVGIFHSSLFEIIIAIFFFIILAAFYFVHKLWVNATFEFNRTSSTVTVPCGFFSKRTTVDFMNVKAEIKIRRGPIGGPGSTLQIYKKDNTTKSHCLDIARPYCESWSWIVWYMDRNRVLPVGEIFDKYRSKDAARLRKAEYPSSLYKATYYIEYITKDFVDSVKSLDIEQQSPIKPLKDETLDALMKSLSPDGISAASRMK